MYVDGQPKATEGAVLRKLKVERIMITGVRTGSVVRKGERGWFHQGGTGAQAFFLLSLSLYMMRQLEDRRIRQGLELVSDDRQLLKQLGGGSIHISHGQNGNRQLM